MATQEVRRYGSAMQPVLEEYVSVNTNFERAAHEGIQMHFDSSEKHLADCVERLVVLDSRLKPIQPPTSFVEVHTDLVAALDTYREGVTAVYRAAQARDAAAMNRAAAICQEAVVQINAVRPRLWQIVREQA